MTDALRQRLVELRAVVTDDNVSLRLTTYRGRDAVAVVELSAFGAVLLAGKLIDAALRRLPQ
jgi:hypothetical protein